MLRVGDILSKLPGIGGKLRMGNDDELFGTGAVYLFLVKLLVFAKTITF